MLVTPGEQCSKFEHLLLDSFRVEGVKITASTLLEVDEEVGRFPARKLTWCCFLRSRKVDRSRAEVLERAAHSKTFHSAHQESHKCRDSLVTANG